MKRTLLVLGMVMALALSTMAGAVADGHGDDTGYATTAFEYDLLAGQDELAGKVYVWDVFGDVYVQYVAKHGWCILETHVEVADGEAGIPQTRRGNPIPGQFSQGETFDDCVTLAGHYIFEDAVDTDGEVVVAAHAAVRKYVETETGTLTPELAWERSSENDVAAFSGFGGQWDPAEDGFEIPLDPDQEVWDNGFYFDNEVPEGRQFASWLYEVTEPAGGSYAGFSDLRRFQASFEVPDGYEVTAGRLNTPSFADGIPINDNVYIFANGPDNLLFWGGTRVNQIAGEFQGMAGVQALRGTTEPVETDRWYIPGSIPDVTNFVEGQNEIDIFTEENEKWGGMGELILELDYEFDVFRYETAWADGDPFVERGNWATYATYEQGSGTLVDFRDRELTFLVFDLGDSSEDLGGMAWVDGAQQYVAHTVCAEVAGDSAWFTYRIPADAAFAGGDWVTFNVTAAGDVGYDRGVKADMVALCENQTPISGGWGGTDSGSVIVHPGA